MRKKPYLSIVSNVRDEEENVEELHRRLTDVCMKVIKRPYEIIYVENGSTDRSLEVLKSLPGATVISLRVPVPPQRSTQTAALDAGIKQATGDIIVTIDSDLQNPPEEIPKLLKKFDEGYDVVSGWRKKRMDSFIIRNLSKFGSTLRNMVINPGVHDLGCTLKAYRRECFDGLNLYGEMHRYITAILKWRGFKVTELEIDHQERKHGKTKYNWKKSFRGFVDMILIWFLQKYEDRPLHLFGIAGILTGMAGTALLVTLGVLRLFKIVSLSSSIWPLIAVLMIMVGLQFFIFGVVIDLLIRNYFATGKEKSYLIKEIVTNPPK
jgi:glycosyltransferase involved in cell wall biosynthesis